ncbi:MAG TPA: hypothetical protein PLQ59_07665 [Fervidobacterium sp.]|nr:hypothetical protein [Fervidobacterium sp.]
MLRREPLGNTLILVRNSFKIPIAKTMKRDIVRLPISQSNRIAVSSCINFAICNSSSLINIKEAGITIVNEAKKISNTNIVLICKKASKLKVFGIQTKYISNSVKTSLLEKKHYVVGILHKRTYSLLKKIGLIISVGIHEIIRKILVYINGLLKDVIYTSRSKIEVLLKIIQGEE